MQQNPFRVSSPRARATLFLLTGIALTTAAFAQGNAVVPGDIEGRSAHDTHAINRWTGLPHDRQLLVLQSLGVAVPQAFFDCVCRAAAYGTSGTSQFYHPDTLGDYDARYSCQQPGPPCIVSGYGCSRHDLPSDPAIFESCAGIDGLDGGNPMDNILEALADRANRKGLTGNPVVMAPPPAEKAPPDCSKQRAMAAGLVAPPKDDIPPEREIFAISPKARKQLQAVEVPADLAETIRQTVAEAIRQHPELTSALVGDEQDLRFDFGDFEVGLSLDSNNRPMLSEIVVKFDTPMTSEDGNGLKVDMGVTFEESDSKGALAGHMMKSGKFGFVYEGDGWEAKYGIDVNLSNSATDFYDGEWQKPSEHTIVRGVEDALSTLDFYVGGAKGTEFSVAGGKVDVGIEASWNVKDRYSRWLFSDMNAALDNLLENQKAWEERRATLIREEASKFGIDARCFSTGQAIRLTREAYEKQKLKDSTIAEPFALLTGRKNDLVSGGAR